MNEYSIKDRAFVNINKTVWTWKLWSDDHLRCETDRYAVFYVGIPPLSLKAF